MGILALLDWKELALLPEEEQEKTDIVRRNLACAAGLPDADSIDEDALFLQPLSQPLRLHVFLLRGQGLQEQILRCDVL